MLDIAFLIAFVALPVVIWWLSRSVLFLTVGLVLGFGLAGNLVQTLIAVGVGWNVRGLQVLGLIVMLVLAVLARLVFADREASLRPQIFGVLIPALVIGAGLVVLRLMAPEDPGALSAVGYFINHPLAEDNAKWLHLSAQIADGRSISFNGYAGGPLLMMMATLSPLISVLSMIFLGGVNQVAVAANTVLAVQFFLIAAVPFALAPFAMKNRRSEGGAGRAVPAALLSISSLFLALASAVVTSYGHLSQQFTFVVLTLWIAAFISRAPRWVLLAASLSVATSVSVWVPLNILGLAILIAAVVLTVRQRWWSGLGAVLATALVTFDAIVSSVVYLFGIELTLRLPAVGGIGGSLGADDEAAAAVPRDPGELIASAHLFRAPGAAEETSAVLAVMAGLVALGAAWLLAKKLDQSGRQAAIALAPMGILVGYTLATTVADALITGSSPNYGASKMAFTVVVAVLAAGLPYALVAIDADAAGMSVLRWAAAFVVVALLLFDSLLPRAVSALSPLLWKGVDAAAPVYWSAAEVRDTGQQPLAQNPIACVFAPPESTQPTALPLGQESYSCTRLLIGLSGLEGEASIIGDWLLTDWQGQTQSWEQFRDSIDIRSDDIRDRGILIMREDQGLAGLTTVGELIDRNPLPPAG